MAPHKASSCLIQTGASQIPYLQKAVLMYRHVHVYTCQIRQVECGGRIGVHSEPFLRKLNSNRSQTLHIPTQVDDWSRLDRRNLTTAHRSSTDADARPLIPC